jgi:hypothetical protein
MFGIRGLLHLSYVYLCVILWHKHGGTSMSMPVPTQSRLIQAVMCRSSNDGILGFKMQFVAVEM